MPAFRKDMAREVKELKRRLRVLEGAMGIDLDSTNKCSGDQATCKADPCNQDRCPMANSYVQQLLNGWDTNTNRLSIVFDFMELLVEHSIIPRALLPLSTAKGELDRWEASVQKVEERSSDPKFVADLRKHLATAQARYSSLREEVCDAISAAQDGD